MGCGYHHMVLTNNCIHKQSCSRGFEYWRFISINRNLDGIVVSWIPVKATHLHMKTYGKGLTGCMINDYKVAFTWDSDADVWIATSEDIHGLILEHSSLDKLIEKVRLAVQELLELENKLHGAVSIDCVASRRELVYV